jgi:inward rectifier potassium channel
MGELGGSTRVFGQFGDERDVVSIGKRHHPLKDLYHHLITASWWQLFFVFGLVYLAINALFAVPFYFLAEGIENVRPGSFADAFFFSLQTMTATEYRPMAAKTVAVEVLAGAEGFVRWIGLALGTGLIFTKFSNPKPRVLFSKVAVVGQHQGVRALMFRMANERSSDIVDAQVKVMLAIDEPGGEEEMVRRVHDLPLWRGDSALFAHTWTAVHHLRAESPLYGRDARTLTESKAELIVSLTGYDETLSRIIHARKIYPASRILWGVRFREILVELRSGRRAIDYRRFHDVVPLDLEPRDRTPDRGRARG